MISFVGAGDREHLGLAEGLSDDLQSDRQPVPGEAAGDADPSGNRPGSRQWCKCSLRYAIAQRIGRPFPALLERRRGRGRRQDGVDLPVGVQKIPADQRADFLRPQIIGVVQ